MIKTHPEHDFMQRTLRTTGLLLLLQFPFTMYYLGTWAAMPILFGGVWGMINILFISRVIRAAVRPGEINKVKVTILLLVKFPLLYTAGYFLLSIEQLKPVLLVAGFSSLFVVALLKALGPILMRATNPKQENHLSVGVTL